MELSIEVEGYIQDLVPKIFSWDKIKAFGKRIGVQTADIENLNTKRTAVETILNKAPRDTAENIIFTLIDMAKKANWDTDKSEQILSEINPILERTMNCRVDEKGIVNLIFPLIKEEQSLIVSELNKIGFARTGSFYEQATITYKSSPKGSLSLLRSAVEALVEEILLSKSIRLLTNFKDRLSQISDLNLLRILSTTECTQCHYRKFDHELNHAYNLFGLLSHYGSHMELVDDALANFLYTSTSAFLWFLTNRYKSLFGT